MADWFVSSVAHAAIAQWAATTAYSIGDIVRQLAAPAAGSERAFRCTTAGTSGGSEPSWTLTKGATTASGTATFTEVTGNATYGWSAAAARTEHIAESWATGTGDRVFLSSDHAETQSTNLGLVPDSSLNNPAQLISVNRAGSVPPVAADVLAGASIATTGAATISLTGTTVYWHGITFTCGSSGTPTMTIGSTSQRHYFKDCAFVSGAGASSAAINVANSTSTLTIFDNTTVQFANAGASLAGSGNFVWKNTPNAIQGGTVPTTLFDVSFNGVAELRGVDLSALGSGEIFSDGASVTRVSVVNCKLGSGFVHSNTNPATPANFFQFINCDSGATNYKHSLRRYRGRVDHETGVVRTGGASDGTQDLAHKYVSASVATVSSPLEGIPLVIWNEDTGSPLTATVEVVSSPALNDDEVWLEIEYLGSASFPLYSRVSDRCATHLTTPAAQATGSGTWQGAWNPADVDDTTFSSDTLTATKSAAAFGGARALHGFSSGLVYFETTIVVTGSSVFRVGFGNSSALLSSSVGVNTNSLGYRPDTGAVIINSSTLATIMTATTGDVLGFAVDLTNSKIWIRKNGGNWNNDVIGNQNPATNTGGISLSTLAAGPYFPMFVDSANSTSVTLNIGASSYGAAAPSGFGDIPRLGQKLSATFTPQMKGLVRATVWLGKESTTVYVDPLITLT